MTVHTEGRPVRALIDTGSPADFMSVTLAEQLRVKCLQCETFYHSTCHAGIAIQGELWHQGPLPVPGRRLRSILRRDKSAILRFDLGDSVPLSASSTSGVELTASDPREQNASGPKGTTSVHVLPDTLSRLYKFDSSGTVRTYVKHDTSQTDIPDASDASPPAAPFAPVLVGLETMATKSHRSTRIATKLTASPEG